MALQRDSKSANRRLSGMTLVEILIALTILSVALVVFLDLTVQGNNIAKKADLRLTALRAANDKLVELQQGRFSYLLTGATTTTVSGLPSGQMTVTISLLDGSSANVNIRQVDIVVTWAADNAQAKMTGGRVRVSSFITLLK